MASYRRAQDGFDAMLAAVPDTFSGHPVPDAAKLVFYRPDFYGARMKEFTHEAMRGPSAWSVGDRELIAAYVSKVNECAFCVGAHSATATRAYQDGTRTGASRQQAEDALPVCFAFDTTDRLADAFGFEVLSPEGFEVLSREGFEAGAKYLLKRGYR